MLLEPCPRFRKGCRTNDDVAEEESIGGVRFVRIDIDQLQVAERVGGHPVAVDEERLRADRSGGRFHMQAILHRDGSNTVTEPGDYLAELIDARRVGAARRADEYIAAD